MAWIDIFIRRPVLTWMLILSMVVFGVLGFVPPKTTPQK